ncbi:MAG: ribosome-associated translation inhibitor RaiA [Clostridia bacterium]|nr:ribosome-associated translation inhibitor RaiA [Clostridia bacterium]
MKITTIGRHMTVGEDQKELAIKKLSKFEKFFGPEAEAFVTFGYKRKLEIIEISISYNGMLFRSEEESSTFANALDEAVESLERQIRKNKTRLEKRLRPSAFDITDGYDDEDIEEEDAFEIRTKTFPCKPISAEEAILQMNLLGHQFFVFANADDNGATCVVYRRKDGAYGLLIPE